MVSIGLMLQRNILNALKRLIHELLVYSNRENDDSIRQVIERLKKNYSLLDRVKPPIIPTRRFIYAVENLLGQLVKLNSVAREYMNKRISLEDLRRIVSEYEEAARLYADIVSNERIKISIYMVLPQTALFATMVYQIFALGVPLPIYVFMSASTLIIVSLFIILINPILSYILNTINAFIILNTLLSLYLSSRPLPSIMLLILYMLTIITSLTYIHVMHVTTSQKSMSMVEKTLLTLLENIGLKGSNQEGEKKKSSEKTEFNRMYEEVKRLYRELYGEWGEEYFRFRYTILLVNGMPPNEILKKFLSEIRNIRDKEK